MHRKRRLEFERKSRAILIRLILSETLRSEKDEVFYDALKNRVEKYQATDADYWSFAEKTPIPMQDYLKVIYDLF